MHGALRSFVLQSLSSESLTRLLGIDSDPVREMLERFHQGSPVRQEQIWSLLHLVLWAEALARPR